MPGTVAVIGGGMAGAVTALELAERGCRVVLFEAAGAAMSGASWVNEGKIHLGFVYGADPAGRTYRRMIDGALAFGPILRRWLGADRLAQAVGAPFDYAVPADSQLPPGAVEAHFGRVQDYLDHRLRATAGDYLGRRSVLPWQRLRRHGYGGPGHPVLAAYATPERAVDTRQLAEAMRAALAAHPGVELRLATRVTRCRPEGGRWIVETGQGPDGPFDQVVNAAWEGRRAIDAASGLDEGGAWLTRYKYAAVVPVAPPLRNLTLMLGRYGDVVRYDAGRVYLSWYPAMMAAQTRGLAPLRPDPGPGEGRHMIVAAWRALAGWYPGLAALRPGLDTVQLIGGHIVARGQSEIDDPHSRLHQRHGIGARHLAPGYVSLDTGKYTAAPLIGAECAEAIAPRARLRPAAS